MIVHLLCLNIQAQSINQTSNTNIAYTSLGNYQKSTLSKHLSYQAFANISLISSLEMDLTKEEPHLLSIEKRKKTLLFTTALLVSSFGLDIYIRSASKKQRYESLDWYLDRTVVLPICWTSLVGFVVEVKRRSGIGQWV